MLDLALEKWTPKEFALERLADVRCCRLTSAEPLRKTFSVIWPFGLVVKANGQDLTVMEWMIAVSAEDHAFMYHSVSTAFCSFSCHAIQHETAKGLGQHVKAFRIITMRRGYRTWKPTPVYHNAQAGNQLFVLRENQLFD